ncbi:MAG: GPW/gp25 family protein [Oscillospiraceae bacterium]|nr:GPW/gp25 family protein [Oscillospiraceae bacterium]
MSYQVSAQYIDKLTLNETDTVRSVLQNVAIILMTPQMSVPLLRGLGLPRRFIDKPVPEAKAILVAEVTAAIQEYEPRAVINNISFEFDEKNPGKMIPVVEIEITNTS